ncbi:Sec-independent protein translocase protein TatB [Kushneria konosiri]|uniref:Sec-independent protein translocase protein TatB n=1 Tax=Kushneria konosiri TaxID=698828 RepID=A0A2Z2H3W6_9GAMM|nr:Sec-independent protein translocase protein TatB [Kushneria konosiri]ARS51915.1 twin-arginine translocase subunit TatB [Kushneria konosiri]
MFDISFPELIVVGAIALVVLGPERLPTAARTAGLWLGKIKRTVSSVQQEITSQLEAEELQRKMKSQQDRFDQGLKKAREDIESLGDDPSAASRKVSDRALSGAALPERSEEQSADAEPLSDRHANTADPSTAPLSAAEAAQAEAAAGERTTSETSSGQTSVSDSHDRDKQDR